MRIQIPEFSMVLLVGTSGSGKSSFARRHFLPTETLSSDTFRALLMDDETDQAATKPAFEALHYMLGKRLELGRLTVVDATNVQAPARKSLINIANQYHALKVAIVFDTPLDVCMERNAARENRQFGVHVIRRQRQDLMRSMGAVAPSTSLATCTAAGTNSKSWWSSLDMTRKRGRTPRAENCSLLATW